MALGFTKTTAERLYYSASGSSDPDLNRTAGFGFGWFAMRTASVADSSAGTMLWIGADAEWNGAIGISVFTDGTLSRTTDGNGAIGGTGFPSLALGEWYYFELHLVGAAVTLYYGLAEDQSSALTSVSLGTSNATFVPKHVQWGCQAGFSNHKSAQSPWEGALKSGRIFETDLDAAGAEERRATLDTTTTSLREWLFEEYDGILNTHLQDHISLQDLTAPGAGSWTSPGNPEMPAGEGETAVAVASTLSALTASFSMAPRGAASVGSTLAALTATGSLSPRGAASLSATLAGLTATGSVAPRGAASVAATLAGLTSTGSVGALGTAAVAATLSALTADVEVAIVLPEALPEDSGAQLLGTLYPWDVALVPSTHSAALRPSPLYPYEAARL